MARSTEEEKRSQITRPHSLRLSNAGAFGAMLDRLKRAVINNAVDGRD